MSLIFIVKLKARVVNARVKIRTVSGDELCMAPGTGVLMGGSEGPVFSPGVSWT